MPWYKSGTVSVAQNSNAVIGTGTSFIANARVGDAFRGPDGGWYEVTNIASDTALSISPNYQGATNAAGAYSLAPMQGYVKDSADALRALVNQFGGVLAVLGQTPTTAGVRSALNLTNTDGLPEGIANKYMTAAAVRAITLAGIDVVTPGAVVSTDTILAALGKLQATKAGKGVNTDITQIAGLTTALSIPQGGTGGTTQAAARSGLGLKSAAIADVVGLMADNAICEYVSNAQGNCVRFAGGVQICHFPIRGLFVDMTTPLGALFSHTGDFAIPGLFPAAFIEAPAISHSYRQLSWYGFCATSTDATATRWPNLKGFCLASVPGNAVYYSITAVGRWK